MLLKVAEQEGKEAHYNAGWNLYKNAAVLCLFRTYVFSNISFFFVFYKENG